MKTIKIISKNKKNNLKIREAARVVMFNKENKIALTYTKKHDTHKLPGGGIEGNETWKQTALREAIEETGFEIELRNNITIGKVIEDRYYRDFIQISYCAVADVTKQLSQTKLTQNEIDNGYIDVAKWVSLEEALKLFEEDSPKTELGKHMNERDKAFIKEALVKLV